MKFAFLFMILVLIGCSTNEVESNNQNDLIPDPTATMNFEGKEFVKVDLETYQRVEDDYEIILTLHSNGEVKSVEHQGFFNACGATVDTSRYFNEEGILIKQIYHDHWMPEGAEGCHESIQDMRITEFYPNGSIKAKKVFRMGYQDTEHEAGIWQEFDENGKIVSTINYGDPYSADEVLTIDFIEKLESYFGESYNTSILSSKGFTHVPRKSLEDGEREYFNAKDGNRIILSKNVYDDGESVFSVNYSVNRNQLVVFQDLLDKMKSTYVYHGSSMDAYLKEGLGTYRSKKIKIDLEKGEISYSHVIGKELSTPLPNFQILPKIDHE